MKKLTKEQNDKNARNERAPGKAPARKADKDESRAQCCAKNSKIVAGCHD
jgi:hypothetical protein